MDLEENMTGDPETELGGYQAEQSDKCKQGVPVKFAEENQQKPKQPHQCKTTNKTFWLFETGSFCGTALAVLELPV